MQLPPENFGSTVTNLRASGFIPIPLNGKTPFMKGWSGFWRHPPSDRVYETWQTKNAKANVGLCLGDIIAVDIDIDDQLGADNAEALVFSTLGVTPFVRIGRAPRRTCFYRLTLEDALETSSWRVGKVEMLAARKQSAILGMHPDTKGPFIWRQQSILSTQKNDIPLVSATQLEALRIRLRDLAGNPQQGFKHQCDTSGTLPVVGERNDSLFRAGCELGHDAASEEALLTSLLSLNSGFSAPLDQAEVVQIAASVWRYKQEGRLWKKGKDAPIVVPVTREIAGEVFKPLGGIACKLYLTLLGTRHTQTEFTITQKTTAEFISCSAGGLSKALKELKHYGLIIDEGKTRGGSSSMRAAKLYKFGSGDALKTV